MRKVLALTLAIASILYTLPTRAAEEPIRHFFNIGVHPVDPDRQINWETECRVELTEPSPTVRLSFVKNGTTGETRPGNIRSGYVIVVDKATGFAKWVSLCGNDVMEPKNWVPTGRKECREPTPSAAPAPEPTPARVETPTPAPAPIVVVQPPPAATPTPAPKPDGNKKGSFWSVVGEVVLGAGIAIGVCALTKRCDFGGHGGKHPGGGGPSPDPPNGPSGGPPN